MVYKYIYIQALTFYVITMTTFVWDLGVALYSKCYKEEGQDTIQKGQKEPLKGRRGEEE